jgi:quercetin dioxygenase-like cupin family protein
VKKLLSAFADITSLGPQRIWDGIIGRSVHGERVTLSLLELDAGAVVPEHSHANEQVGLLLEGSVSFTIGGETREVTRGGTWRILANVPHSVVVGPDGALIVEVFSPIRDDWHAIEQQRPRPGRWP